MSKGTYNQLLTNDLDVESNFLTKNPDVTFFNTLFRRHINFSTEEKEIIIPSLKDNVKNISVIIPKIGDFISKIYLVVHLPTIYNKYKKWTNKQMKDYLNKYNINYTYTNGDNDYLTEDNFIDIVGNLYYDSNKNKWVRETPGLISEYIDELIKQKELYEKIIEISQSITADNIDDYLQSLYTALFDIYKPDADLYNYMISLIDTIIEPTLEDYKNTLLKLTKLYLHKQKLIDLINKKYSDNPELLQKIITIMNTITNDNIDDFNNNFLNAIDTSEYQKEYSNIKSLINTIDISDNKLLNIINSVLLSFYKSTLLTLIDNQYESPILNNILNIFNEIIEQTIDEFDGEFKEKIISNYPDEFNIIQTLINEAHNTQINQETKDILKSALYTEYDKNYITPIFNYLWSYINDEHAISTFDLPEDIPIIEKFLNVLDHDISENNKYILSTDTPYVNQGDEINIYDSKTSWVADNIIEPKNSTISLIEPTEGTVVKINKPFDNMSINFLKNYCNIDDYSSGFGMCINNKILNSFKNLYYFDENIKANNSIGRYSIFPYYLPENIGENKLIRRKFYLKNKPETVIINNKYKITTTPNIINENEIDIRIDVHDLLPKADQQADFYYEKYKFVKSNKNIDNRYFNFTINGYTEDDTILFELYLITYTNRLIKEETVIIGDITKTIYSLTCDINSEKYIPSPLQIYKTVSNTNNYNFQKIIIDDNIKINNAELNPVFYYFDRDTINFTINDANVQNIQINEIYKIENNILIPIDLSKLNGLILTYDMKGELSNNNDYTIFLDYNANTINSKANETFYIFFVINNTVQSIKQYTNSQNEFYVYLYSNTKNIKINEQYKNDTFNININPPIVQSSPYRDVDYNGIYKLTINDSKNNDFTLEKYILDNGIYIFEYLNNENNKINLNDNVFININNKIYTIDKSTLNNDVILFNKLNRINTKACIYNQDNYLSDYKGDYKFFYIINKFSSANLQLYYIIDNKWDKYNPSNKIISYDGKTWRLNVDGYAEYINGFFKNFIVGKDEYINNKVYNYINTPVCGVINKETYGLLTDTIDLIIQKKYDYFIQCIVNEFVNHVVDNYANGAIIDINNTKYIQNMITEIGNHTSLNTDFTGFVADYIVDDYANIAINDDIYNENYFETHTFYKNENNLEPNEIKIYSNVLKSIITCTKNNNKYVLSEPILCENVLILNDMSVYSKYINIEVDDDFSTDGYFNNKIFFTASNGYVGGEQLLSGVISIYSTLTHKLGTYKIETSKLSNVITISSSHYHILNNIRIYDENTVNLVSYEDITTNGFFDDKILISNMASQYLSGYVRIYSDIDNYIYIYNIEHETLTRIKQCLESDIENLRNISYTEDNFASLQIGDDFKVDNYFDDKEFVDENGIITSGNIRFYSSLYNEIYAYNVETNTIINVKQSIPPSIHDPPYITMKIKTSTNNEILNKSKINDDIIIVHKSINNQTKSPQTLYSNNTIVNQPFIYMKSIKSTEIIDNTEIIHYGFLEDINTIDITDGNYKQIINPNIKDNLINLHDNDIIIVKSNMFTKYTDNKSYMNYYKFENNKCSVIQTYNIPYFNNNVELPILIKSGNKNIYTFSFNPTSEELNYTSLYKEYDTYIFDNYNTSHAFIDINKNKIKIESTGNIHKFKYTINDETDIEINNLPIDMYTFENDINNNRYCLYYYSDKQVNTSFYTKRTLLISIPYENNYNINTYYGWIGLINLTINSNGDILQTSETNDFIMFYTDNLRKMQYKNILYSNYFKFLFNDIKKDISTHMLRIYYGNKELINNSWQLVQFNNNQMCGDALYTIKNQTAYYFNKEYEFIQIITKPLPIYEYQIISSFKTTNTTDNIFDYYKLSNTNKTYELQYAINNISYINDKMTENTFEYSMSSKKWIITKNNVIDNNTLDIQHTDFIDYITKNCIAHKNNDEYNIDIDINTYNINNIACKINNLQKFNTSTFNINQCNNPIISQVGRYLIVNGGYQNNKLIDTSRIYYLNAHNIYEEFSDSFNLIPRYNVVSLSYNKCCIIAGGSIISADLNTIEFIKYSVINTPEKQNINLTLNKSRNNFTGQVIDNYFIFAGTNEIPDNTANRDIFDIFYIDNNNELISSQVTETSEFPPYISYLQSSSFVLNNNHYILFFGGIINSNETPMYNNIIYLYQVSKNDDNTLTFTRINIPSLLYYDVILECASIIPITYMNSDARLLLIAGGRNGNRILDYFASYIIYLENNNLQIIKKDVQDSFSNPIVLSKPSYNLSSYYFNDKNNKKIIMYFNGNTGNDTVKSNIEAYEIIENNNDIQKPQPFYLKSTNIVMIDDFSKINATSKIVKISGTTSDIIDEYIVNAGGQNNGQLNIIYNILTYQKNSVTHFWSGDKLGNDCRWLYAATPMINYNAPGYNKLTDDKYGKPNYFITAGGYNKGITENKVFYYHIDHNNELIQEQAEGLSFNSRAGSMTTIEHDKKQYALYCGGVNKSAESKVDAYYFDDNNNLVKYPEIKLDQRIRDNAAVTITKKIGNTEYSYALSIGGYNENDEALNIIYAYKLNISSSFDINTLLIKQELTLKTLKGYVIAKPLRWREDNGIDYSYVLVFGDNSDYVEVISIDNNGNVYVMSDPNDLQPKHFINSLFFRLQESRDSDTGPSISYYGSNGKYIYCAYGKHNGIISDQIDFYTIARDNGIMVYEYNTANQYLRYSMYYANINMFSKIHPDFTNTRLNMLLQNDTYIYEGITYYLIYRNTELPGSSIYNNQDSRFKNIYNNYVMKFNKGDPITLPFTYNGPDINAASSYPFEYTEHEISYNETMHQPTTRMIAYTGRYSGGTFATDRYIYLLGGNNKNSFINNAERYDYSVNFRINSTGKVTYCYPFTLLSQDPIYYKINRCVGVSMSTKYKQLESHESPIPDKQVYYYGGLCTGGYGRRYRDETGWYLWGGDFFNNSIRGYHTTNYRDISSYGAEDQCSISVGDDFDGEFIRPGSVSMIFGGSSNMYWNELFIYSIWVRNDFHDVGCTKVQNDHIKLAKKAKFRSAATLKDNNGNYYVLTFGGLSADGPTNEINIIKVPHEIFAINNDKYNSSIVQSQQQMNNYLNQIDIIQLNPLNLCTDLYFTTANTISKTINSKKYSYALIAGGGWARKSISNNMSVFYWDDTYNKIMPYRQNQLNGNSGKNGIFNLTHGGHYMASAVIKDNNNVYCLFAGGSTDESEPSTVSTVYSDIDIYTINNNGELEKCNYTQQLSQPKAWAVGIGLGKYAFFAGGYTNYNNTMIYTDTIDIFEARDNMIIKRDDINIKLNNVSSGLTATTLGNYIIFAGGQYDNDKNYIYQDTTTILFYDVENNTIIKTDNTLLLTTPRKYLTSSELISFVNNTEYVLIADGLSYQGSNLIYYDGTMDLFNITSQDNNLYCCIYDSNDGQMFSGYMYYINNEIPYLWEVNDISILYNNIIYHVKKNEKVDNTKLINNVNPNQYITYIDENYTPTIKSEDNYTSVYNNIKLYTCDYICKYVIYYVDNIDKIDEIKKLVYYSNQIYYLIRSIDDIPNVILNVSIDNLNIKYPKYLQLGDKYYKYNNGKYEISDITEIPSNEIYFTVNNMTSENINDILNYDIICIENNTIKTYYIWINNRYQQIILNDSNKYYNITQLLFEHTTEIMCYYHSNKYISISNFVYNNNQVIEKFMNYNTDTITYYKDKLFYDENNQEYPLNETCILYNKHDQYFYVFDYILPESNISKYTDTMKFICLNKPSNKILYQLVYDIVSNEYLYYDIEGHEENDYNLSIDVIQNKNIENKNKTYSLIKDNKISPLNYSKILQLNNIIIQKENRIYRLIEPEHIDNITDDFIGLNLCNLTTNYNILKNLDIFTNYNLNTIDGRNNNILNKYYQQIIKNENDIITINTLDKSYYGYITVNKELIVYKYQNNVLSQEIFTDLPKYIHNNDTEYWLYNNEFYSPNNYNANHTYLIFYNNNVYEKINNVDKLLDIKNNDCYYCVNIDNKGSNIIMFVKNIIIDAIKYKLDDYKIINIDTKTIKTPTNNIPLDNNKNLLYRISNSNYAYNDYLFAVCIENNEFKYNDLIKPENTIYYFEYIENNQLSEEQINNNEDIILDTSKFIINIYENGWKKYVTYSDNYKHIYNNLIYNFWYDEKNNVHLYIFDPATYNNHTTGLGLFTLYDYYYINEKYDNTTKKYYYELMEYSKEETNNKWIKNDDKILYIESQSFILNYTHKNNIQNYTWDNTTFNTLQISALKVDNNHLFIGTLSNQQYVLDISTGELSILDINNVYNCTSITKGYNNKIYFALYYSSYFVIGEYRDSVFIVNHQYYVNPYLTYQCNIITAGTQKDIFIGLKQNFFIEYFEDPVNPEDKIKQIYYPDKLQRNCTAMTVDLYNNVYLGFENTNYFMIYWYTSKTFSIYAFDDTLTCKYMITDLNNNVYLAFSNNNYFIMFDYTKKSFIKIYFNENHDIKKCSTMTFTLDNKIYFTFIDSPETGIYDPLHNKYSETMINDNINTIITTGTNGKLYLSNYTKNYITEYTPKQDMIIKSLPDYSVCTSMINTIDNNITSYKAKLLYRICQKYINDYKSQLITNIQSQYSEDQELCNNIISILNSIIKININDFNADFKNKMHDKYPNEDENINTIINNTTSILNVIVNVFNTITDDNITDFNTNFLSALSSINTYDIIKDIIDNNNINKIYLAFNNTNYFVSYTPKSLKKIPYQPEEIKYIYYSDSKNRYCNTMYFYNYNDKQFILFGFNNSSTFGIYDLITQEYTEHKLFNGNDKLNCLSIVAIKKQNTNQTIILFGFENTNYIIRCNIDESNNDIFNDINKVELPIINNITCKVMITYEYNEIVYLGFYGSSYIGLYYPFRTENNYITFTYPNDKEKQCTSMVLDIVNKNLYIGFNNSDVFSIYNITTNAYYEKNYGNNKRCNQILLIDGLLYFNFTNYNYIGIYDINNDKYTEQEYLSDNNKNSYAMCSYNNILYLTYINTDNTYKYLQKGKYRNNSYFLHNFSGKIYTISRKDLIDNITMLNNEINQSYIIMYNNGKINELYKITYEIEQKWVKHDISDIDKWYYYDYESQYDYVICIADNNDTIIIDNNNYYKVINQTFNIIQDFTGTLETDLKIPKIINYELNKTAIVYENGTVNNIDNIKIKYRYTDNGLVTIDNNGNNLFSNDIHLIDFDEKQETYEIKMHYICNDGYYNITINKNKDKIEYSVSELNIFENNEIQYGFIDCLNKMYYYYNNGLQSYNYDNNEEYILLEPIDNKIYKFITHDLDKIPIIPNELVEITSNDYNKLNYFNKINNKVYNIIKNGEDIEIKLKNIMFDMYLLNNDLITNTGVKYNVYTPIKGDGIVIVSDLENNNKNTYYSFDGKEWKNHIYIDDLTDIVVKLKHYIIKQIAEDSNCRFLLFKYIKLYDVNNSINKMSFIEYFDNTLSNYLSENTKQEIISKGYFLTDKLTNIYNTYYLKLKNNNYTMNDIIMSYDDVVSFKDRIYSELHDIITSEFIYNIHLFQSIINRMNLIFTNDYNIGNNNAFVFDYVYNKLNISGFTEIKYPKYFNINDYITEYSNDNSEKYLYDNFIIPTINEIKFKNYDNSELFIDTELYKLLQSSITLFKNNILDKYKVLYDNGISQFLFNILGDGTETTLYLRNNDKSYDFTQDSFYENTKLDESDNNNKINYYSYRTIKEFFEYCKYNTNGASIEDHGFINIMKILNHLTNSTYNGGQIGEIYETKNNSSNSYDYIIHNSIQSAIVNDIENLFNDVNENDKNNILKYTQLISNYIINTINEGNNDNPLHFNIEYLSNNKYFGDVIDNLYNWPTRFLPGYVTSNMLHVYFYVIRTKYYNINYIKPNSNLSEYEITNNLMSESNNPIRFVVMSYYCNLAEYIYYNIPSLKKYIPKIKIICDSYLKEGINSDGNSYLYKIGNDKLPELFENGELYKYHRILDVFSGWCDYLLDMIKDEYNTLFNTLLDNQLIDKMYNPFKECRDYICDNIYNSRLTDNLSKQIDNTIDFYYNMDKIDTYTIDYCNNILNKTIDNYTKSLKYNDILEYLDKFQMNKISNKYQQSIKQLIEFHTYIYNLIKSDNTFIDIELFRTLMKDADITDTDLQGLSYVNDNDVLEYAYRKLWNDILNNVNQLIMKTNSMNNYSFVNIFFDNKSISCFDLLIDNHTNPLNEININPYNSNTQPELYNWYIKYILYNIYTSEYNYRNTKGISRLDISFMMYLHDILNNQVEIRNNEINLIKWFEKYKDYNTNTWDKVKDIYGIFYEITKAPQMTPNSFYNKYQDIINSRFNGFETEMDFVRFLIWYLIKQSEFSDILDLEDDTIDETKENIKEYYEEKINNIDNILKLIGVKEEYDQNNYSDLEDYIRLLMNNQNSNLMYCRWIKNVGLHLIKSIDLMINDQVIENLNGEYLNILSKLIENKNHEEGYNNIVNGNDLDITKYNEEKFIIKGNELIIPIMFTISKYIMATIPLIALQHSEVKLRIQYTNIDDLIEYDTSGVLNKVWSNEQDYILMKYMYIDNNYRADYAKSKQGILIEQPQYYDNIIVDINESNDYIIPVNFSNCSKEFFVVCQLNNKIDYDFIKFNKEEMDFYDITLQKEIKDNINKNKGNYMFIKEIDIDDAKDYETEEYIKEWNKSENLIEKEIRYINVYDYIYINGKQIGNEKKKYLRKYIITKKYISFINEIEIRYSGRIRERIHGEKVYSLLKKYECHTQNNYDGIYVYSFSLKPEYLQPSGECNLSRTGQLEVRLIFNDEINEIINGNEGNKQINIRVGIYNISYNILRIMSGLGGVLFR